MQRLRHLRAERPDVLFVSPDPFFVIRRAQLATLAARYAIPTSFSARDFVEVGGLMSYGTNVNGCLSSSRRLHRPHPQGRETRGLAGRAIDQVRARHQRARPHACSASTIPPSLLAVADEVIE